MLFELRITFSKFTFAYWVQCQPRTQYIVGKEHPTFHRLANKTATNKLACWVLFRIKKICVINVIRPSQYIALLIFLSTSNLTVQNQLVLNSLVPQGAWQLTALRGAKTPASRRKPIVKAHGDLMPRMQGLLRKSPTSQYPLSSKHTKNEGIIDWMKKSQMS